MTRLELVQIIAEIVEDTVEDESLQQGLMQCVAGEFRRQESQIKDYFKKSESTLIYSCIPETGRKNNA